MVPPRDLRIRHTVIAIGVGLSFFLLALAILWSQALKLEDATLTMQGESDSTRSIDLPFREETPDKSTLSFVVRFSYGLVSTSQFTVSADDCLQSLKINGRVFDHPSIPFCTYDRTLTVDLGPLLHHGQNVIVAEIFNNGGIAAFSLVPVATPFAMLLLWILIFTAVGLTLVLLRIWHCPDWGYLLAGVLFFAILLRIVYMVQTPYWIRGHDTEGHIEYIEFIASHGVLPKPDAGWEFWQPPLYYMFGAVWWSIGNLLGMTRNGIIAGLQIGSLLLSILQLRISVAMGRLLLPGERKRWLPAFVALTGFLPGIVMFSARINNDVLLAPLCALTLLLLLHFWQKRTFLPWFLMSIIVSLAVLTKLNAFLLVCLAMLLLVLRMPLRAWRRTLLYSGVLMTMLVVFNAWFFTYRIVSAPSQGALVGNLNVLNSALRLHTSFSTLTTFNPVKVLQHPYNNPWSDASRRQEFPEYLFRSSLTGEFDFGTEKSLITTYALLISMLICLLALWGVVRGLFQRQPCWLPLTLTFLSLFLGHVCFRIGSPFASSQDFRYSTLLVYPIAAFAAFAASSFKQPLVRFCSATLFVLMTVFSVMILIE